MIESGIPIPPMCRQSRFSHLMGMKVGDCYLCQTEKEANSVRSFMRGKGWSTSTRKIPNQGWRVWRVEDRKPKFGLRVVA